MMNIKFIPVGMRTSLNIDPRESLIANTCSDNDSTEIGDLTHWSWANPTNRRFQAVHSKCPNITAVSTECLWQGTKLFEGQLSPDLETLSGNWRRGKAKRPIGAWAGEDVPMYTDPGIARVNIYLPAFIKQLYNHLSIPAVIGILRYTLEFDTVYLRDWDTGQGVFRNGPMSHAWIISEILNGDFDHLHLNDAEILDLASEIYNTIKE